MILLLRSDGIILKSRKCGRESEKILEKISLIWLISLNFSQPGKILKQFLCFVKLPGEISRTGGWGARGDLSRERSQELSLSLLLFCCDNWKHGVDIVFLGYSQDTPATPSHTTRYHSFKISPLRVNSLTECLTKSLTGCLTKCLTELWNFLRSRVCTECPTVSPGVEVCFVGNQSDDDRTISC